MRSSSALFLVLACGVCAPGTASPLAIKVSHSGNFLQGQSNAFYLIRVSNPAINKSSGTVLVTDNAQSGMKITSLSGEGWTCSDVSCSRDDALPAGHAYPAIVALATVDYTAPTKLTYTATVTRHGTLNATANDVTAIDARGIPIAWGTNQYRQSSVPHDLVNVVAIAAGSYHVLALKSDGTVLAWGDNSAWQTNVPAMASNVVAIAAGGNQSLALRQDGSVVASCKR